MLIPVVYSAVQLLFKQDGNACEYLTKNVYPNYHGKLPSIQKYQNMLDIVHTDVISGLFIAKKECKHLKMIKEENVDVLESDYEMKNIIYAGNPDNRIDVVFMGDGYTLQERALFYKDIERLVNEMWNGETFKPLLPMFNIWALHLPSKDSGISFQSNVKNTAFGLQREENQLRAIMPKNANLARKICSQLGTKCDYPSLIGNDPFYGGLGGEFVISTSSKTTGTTVLRHEMGHNFATEGEEYDDGYVYSGYNSASSINSIAWRHWATTPITGENKLNMLATEHPWASLATPYSINFKTSSGYNYLKILISLSGVETSNTVEVAVDGVPLSYTSSNTLDRQFYYWKFKKPLAVGQHVLKITQLKAPSLQDPRTGGLMQRTVCSLDVHEYKDNVFEKMTEVGAFPTWDIRGRKSYRPTNDMCIMRNMTSHTFCPVCMEGMHLNFLKKIKLMDFVNVTCTADGASATIAALPYGQLSSDLNDSTNYVINWSKGAELKEYKDKVSVNGLSNGVYTVNMRLETPHVRLNSTYLTDKKSFEVKC